MRSQAFEARLKRLKHSLSEKGFQGGILVPGPNLRYFTGVNSLLLERPFMLLVPVDGEPQLVAPKLEAGPYRSCPIDIRIHEWTDSEGWDRAIGGAAKELRVKGKWGVEGKVPYLFLHRLLKHASPRLGDAEPVLQGLREVKDEEEIALLKKAARILSKSFEQFPEIVREGSTELEMGKTATEMIYDNGATKVEDVLVQSGPRAADPHGLPSSRKVKQGEGVIFDISCSYRGYFADVTRVICQGKPSNMRELYERVLEAEEKGIRAAAAGVATGDVDAAARNHLKMEGLGKYFIHRTGHGLGLEVHEAPYIVEGGKEKLRNGMCFTVEPGAYLRGKMGVRIEDNILIEGGRGVEITTPPKEYGWWA